VDESPDVLGGRSPAQDLRAQNAREEVIHSDDLERIRDERKAALARALPVEFEQRKLGKDGQFPLKAIDPQVRRSTAG
jgi:hypothetical protein